MEIPSQLVQDAVAEISKLPGIGKKTALRLALHLLKKPTEFTEGLAFSLTELRTKIKYCPTCHMILDDAGCICKSAYRDQSVICVVEDTPDVLAILNTGQFNGTYHVLGGKISPMEGIGAEDIHINSLVKRIEQSEGVKEIILALSATMEGDTTAFYITKLLKKFDLKITSIARGISVGSELEFTDEVTLGRSIATRILFNQE